MNGIPEMAMRGAPLGLAEPSLRDRVRAFVGENFYVPDLAKLDDEGSLVESGIVDSTGILEVISFLEEEFHIQVENTEAVPANLDSIRNIVAFVGRKIAQPVPIAEKAA